MEFIKRLNWDVVLVHLVRCDLHSYDEPDLQKAVEYACMKFNNSGLSSADGQRILMHVEN